MSNRLGGRQGTAYTGTNAVNPPNITYNERDPNQFDTLNYSVGDEWINTSGAVGTQKAWKLMSLQGTMTSAGELANWVLFTSGKGSSDTLTGNTGGAVPVDSNANINTLGDNSSIEIDGNPATFTLTTSIKGVAAATDGQVFIASSSGAPLWRNITAGTNISIANAGNSITITATGGSGSGITTLVGTSNNGTATADGANKAYISPGSNLTVNGDNMHTITVGLTGLTQHAILVGGASGTSITPLSLGTSLQVLQSGGGAADPAYSTATYPATTAQGDLLISASANAITSLAKSAVATRYLANTGASNNAQWDQVNLTNGVTGVLPIANGGTNASSMATTDGTVYFDGTRLVTTATGTSGEVLTSNGAGMAPTYQPPAATPAKTSAFFVTGNGTENNVTGLGAFYTLAGFNVVEFDLGGNFSGSSTFTAPVTGKYQFNFSIMIGSLNSSANSCIFRLIVNGGATYILNTSQGAWGKVMDAANQFSDSFATLINLSSGDTVNLQVKVDNMGSSTASVIYTGGGVNLRTFWSGYLVTT